MGNFCQKEQIPILSEKHGRVSKSSFKRRTLSAPWVNKLQFYNFFFNVVTFNLTEEV